MWKKIGLMAGGFFAVLFIYAMVVVVLNRTAGPSANWIRMPEIQEEHKKLLTDQLSILSWNIGYGALGRSADFIADGGSSLISSDKPTVIRNSAAINDLLADSQTDVILLQEVSDGSFLNRWVDQLALIKEALPMHALHFRKDVSTRFLPWPLRINHGTVLASETVPQQVEIVPLPLEPGHLMGVIKRRYGLQVARFARAQDDREWVVINLHLSAFDEGDVRLKQLRVVLDYARDEFDKGNFVVVGGDWNMEIETLGLPHSTGVEHLFWLRPFPKDQLDVGWQIVSDDKVPTVRTLHKPYVAGENYVAAIDGFLLSPNVELVRAGAVDLGFVHTDHHPVRLDVRAKSVE